MPKLPSDRAMEAIASADQQAREEFASAVLCILEASRDWSADTLDEIAEQARALGLGECDAEGFFRQTGKH